MPDKGVLINGIHPGEEVIINKSVAHERVNSKVTHPESCKILKKVCALARIDAIVLKSRFYDEP